MTDRVRTLTVVLDQDIRVDDVETIAAAISMVKHVQEVRAGEAVDGGDWLARATVGARYEKALWEMFKKVRDGEV